MFGICVGSVLVLAGVATMIHRRTCGSHRGAIGCVLRRLKATPEQRAQIEPIVQGTVERLRATRGRAKDLRAQFAAAWTEEPLDRSKLERLEASLFEATGEFTQILRDAVSQLHPILNAEQRAKVSLWLTRRHGCHAHQCHAGC